jgi:quercetin dioxygenase-like cupin family protein
MMRRAILLLAVGVTVLTLFVGAALATTPSDATSTLLTRATLGTLDAANDGIKVKSSQRSADVSVVRVDLSAGGSTGWHHHPGVVMVSVASGTVTEYDEDCRPTVVQAGQGFVESRDEVHLVRNEGNDAAVLYATFISPTETPALRIDDPQPQTCNKL